MLAILYNHAELESTRFDSLPFLLSNSKQLQHVSKYIVQNIEEAWSFVTLKPCNTLKRTFRLRNILNLGEFVSISNVVALSPQVSISAIQNILND